MTPEELKVLIFNIVHEAAQDGTIALDPDTIPRFASNAHVFANMVIGRLMLPCN